MICRVIRYSIESLIKAFRLDCDHSFPYLMSVMLCPSYATWLYYYETPTWFITPESTTHSAHHIKTSKNITNTNFANFSSNKFKLRDVFEGKFDYVHNCSSLKCYCHDTLTWSCSLSCYMNLHHQQSCSQCSLGQMQWVGLLMHYQS